MSLLGIIIVLVVFGVLLYLINAFIPMESNIKRLMNIVVVIILIIWILYAIGAIGYLSNVRV